MMQKNFWVTEVGNGYGQTIEVKEKLCEKQSKFQKIEVYEKKADSSKMGKTKTSSPVR